MSADEGDSGGDSGPGRREVAYRPFAAEFDDASLSYSESDEERAPNYVVTPTGLRVNRLFAVGVLTEVERINTETLRGRIVDPTGAFVTYAGQYQPEAQAFLDGATPPAFVAITGKARTFEPDDSDRVFTSVRPESLSEVTAETRDRWVVSAAEHTLERLAVFAAARETGHTGEALRAALEAAGVDDSIAAGIPRAIEHYGTTTAYLEAIRRLAVDALEVVAGEREEVRAVDVAPDEGGDVTLGSLPELDLDLPTGDSGADATPADAPEATQPAEPASTSTSTDEDTELSADEGSSATEETTPTSDAATSAPTDETPATTPTDDAPATTPADDAPATTPADGAPATTPADDAPATTPADESSDPTTAESAGSEAPPADTVDDDVDTAAAESEDAGMYQLDDDEREELEAEFGSDFSSGNDVDPAGEADIDVPDVDELAEPAGEQANQQAGDDAAAETADTVGADPVERAESAEPTTGSDTDLGSFAPGSEASTTAEPDGVDESDEAVAADEASQTDEATDDDVDLEDAAVELMADLDDGDGADREAVVSRLVEAHGVEPASVEEAIADALMSGRCYEPDAGVLKAI